MDPLSDLLRMVRLDAAFFYSVEAAEPWSVETLAARELAPRIMLGAEHLISYHIVTEGRGYGGVVGDEQVELAAGDVILFPHGDAHHMSSERDLRLRDDMQLEPPSRYPFVAHVGEEGPRVTSFFCGFLGCDRRPFNPLLAALPRVMHMPGMSNPWFSGFTRQLTEESRQGRAGIESVMTRLAEVMFIEVLRVYLDSLPPGQTGWLAGLRDEVVGPALALLHDDPSRSWTVAELAKETSSSRTSLSQRFTDLVGQPPMRYLAQWRMQVAANQLAQTTANVSTIGRRVGYDSEAAFSRAFKKATGLAPGAWREMRHSNAEARSTDA